jgi:hypothetical protein
MSKNTLIIERIAALEAILNKSGNQLGLEAGIGNGTVGGWNDNLIGKPSLAVEKFLRHYNIRDEWWKTFKGEIFNTSVPNQTDNKGKSMSDIVTDTFSKMLATDAGEYYMVPKAVFEGNYRFVPIEEFEMREKELEMRERELTRRHDDLVRKDTQIQGLYDLFRLALDGRNIQVPEAPKTEEGQKNTSV